MQRNHVRYCESIQTCSFGGESLSTQPYGSRGSSNISGRMSVDAALESALKGDEDGLFDFSPNSKCNETTSDTVNPSKLSPLAKGDESLLRSFVSVMTTSTLDLSCCSSITHPLFYPLSALFTRNRHLWLVFVDSSNHTQRCLQKG